MYLFIFIIFGGVLILQIYLLISKSINNRNKENEEKNYKENEKIIEELKSKLPFRLTLTHKCNLDWNLSRIERQEKIIELYKNNLLELEQEAKNEKNRIFADDEINGYIDYYDLAKRIIKAEGKYKIYFTEKQRENLNNDLLQETIKAIQNPDINYYNSIFSKNKTYSFVKSYIVFDLETTGLNCVKDKIIEIGALKYKNGKLIDTFHYFVNPRIDIDNEISSLTGITNDMLKNEKTIDKILPKFVDFIENYTLVAHNSSFDLSFIERNLKLLNMNLIENKNIDTLFLARKYITFTKNHKLVTLKQALNLKYKSHNALDDCYVTNEVYNYCRNIKEQNK